jgi:cytoskeletal protein CcmA (bactofilin family)
MTDANETAIVIDPPGMNIVNRVAAGTNLAASHYVSDGGIMIEGTLRGKVWVRHGPAVLWTGARFAGRLYVDGDAYLFGNIEPSEGEPTQIVVTGTVYLAQTLVAKADIAAGAFRTFHGAQTQGTIRSGLQTLPPIPAGMDPR